MRRRIAWLVAATTSAVVLAFVVPLCLLIRATTQDRAMAAGDQEARNVAIIVSTLHGSPTLRSVVDELGRRLPAETSVLLPDGAVLGHPADQIGSDALVVRARNGSAFTRVDAAGGHILVPVVTPDGVDVVRTTVSKAALRDGVTRAWLSIAMLGVVLMLAAVLIADRLAMRISTPVIRVAWVADQLREGDLAARATPTGPHETVALAEALNRLAARIVELLANERAAVGDLSHRLRTPVTALRLDVESVPDPAVAELLRVHVGRLQRTIDAIVKDARRPLRTDIGASCDVVETVRGRVRFWSALAEEQGRPVASDLPDHAIPVAAHAGDVQDIVDIAVDNVFAHTAEGVGFAVAVEQTRESAVLVIGDDAPWVDPTDRTSDRVGHTGLGLDIARRTARGFGGELVVDTGQVGTRIRVTLPRTP
ncbi:MAG: HAMP domain-containing sensor histidine kinase [Marmoricola sp.]